MDNEREIVFDIIKRAMPDLLKMDMPLFCTTICLILEEYAVKHEDVTTQELADNICKAIFITDKRNLPPYKSIL